MKTTLSHTHRFHRVLLLAAISLCCFLVSQSTFAERYYYGRGAHYSCPHGYQLVLISAHWSNGYFVPARYICAPAYQRHHHYRHHHQYYNQYYNGSRDGYYGRHHRNW